MEKNNLRLRRQPFIPMSGWKIVYNEFYDIHPTDNIHPEGSEHTPSWSWFSSTLLRLLNEKLELLIDLGWYPESDPKGEFGITVLRSDDKHWEHPLYEFSSRNKDKIVDKLNELMAECLGARLNRL